MFNTDTESRRVLVREHQESLRQDAVRASRLAGPEEQVEEPTRRHHFRLPHLRIRFHPVRLH